MYDSNKGYLVGGCTYTVLQSTLIVQSVAISLPPFSHPGIGSEGP